MATPQKDYTTQNTSTTQKNSSYNSSSSSISSSKTETVSDIISIQYEGRTSFQYNRKNIIDVFPTFEKFDNTNGINIDVIFENPFVKNSTKSNNGKPESKIANFPNELQLFLTGDKELIDSAIKLTKCNLFSFVNKLSLDNLKNFKFTMNNKVYTNYKELIYMYINDINNKDILGVLPSINNCIPIHYNKDIHLLLFKEYDEVLYNKILNYTKYYQPVMVDDYLLTKKKKRLFPTANLFLLICHLNLAELLEKYNHYEVLLILYKMYYSIRLLNSEYINLLIEQVILLFGIYFEEENQVTQNVVDLIAAKASISPTYILEVVYLGDINALLQLILDAEYIHVGFVQLIIISHKDIAKNELMVKILKKLHKQFTDNYSADTGYNYDDFDRF